MVPAQGRKGEQMTYYYRFSFWHHTENKGFGFGTFTSKVNHRHPTEQELRDVEKKIVEFQKVDGVIIIGMVRLRGINFVKMEGSKE